MATTIATDLSNGQIAMVAAARYTYESKSLTPQLFTRMQLEQGEKSKYIPKFGKITAADLTDGVDMTEAQQLSITGTTHSTDEAGCKVIITKKLRHQLKEDAYRAAGIVVGNGMNKKIDQDGLTLFSGLDIAIGAAGSTFSLNYLQAAVSQCLGQEEPVPEPIVCVIHPYHLHNVVGEIATPASTTVAMTMPDAIQSAALLQHFRGIEKLFATRIYATARITADTADDAYGAVFAKEAFIYLVGWGPDNWIVYKDSLRGWEIGIVADYAMVEEDGSYGRALLFDASAPVS